MLQPIVQPLQELAAGCYLEERTAGVQGVEIWTLTEEDLERLLACYSSLVVGGLNNEAITMLIDADVPVWDLVSDEPVDMITRADLSEIASVASLIAIDDWPIDLTHMPNVPKQSRRTSEHGIDAMACQVREEELPLDLMDGELLLIASVKHSIAKAFGSLVSDLRKSVGADLTGPYMMTQLRAYVGHLDQVKPNIDHSRLFLFLRDFPDPNHVRATAFAIVDSARVTEIVETLEESTADMALSRPVRVLLFNDLDSIHERCI